jgi:hypothetical protein
MLGYIYIYIYVCVCVRFGVQCVQWEQAYSMGLEKLKYWGNWITEPRFSRLPVPLWCIDIMKEKHGGCRNQPEPNATPNHSILSHGCREEDAQGLDGDECRGADSSCVLANLFTGLDKVQRRSYPPCCPIHRDPQDSLSHTWAVRLMRSCRLHL